MVLYIRPMTTGEIGLTSTMVTNGVVGNDYVLSRAVGCDRGDVTQCHHVGCAFVVPDFFP